jgi:hypothetical protein
MRQSLIILFIASLSVPFISVFSWLQIEKSTLRREVKHQIMDLTRDEELITFTFHKNDTLKTLDWEHPGEFEYQGEMYDVVRREYQDDKVTYHLWWDHEETILNRQLTDLTTSLFNHSPAKEKSSKQLSFFFDHLYADQMKAEITKATITAIDSSFYYLSISGNHTPEVQSPPPCDSRFF